MKCPKCHKINKPERKYCKHCGEQLFIFCVRCGFTNDRSDAYCGGCGINLSDMFDSDKRPELTFLTSGLSAVEDEEEKVEPGEEEKEKISDISSDDGFSKNDLLELIGSSSESGDKEEQKKKKSVEQNDIDNLFGDD